MAIASGVFNSMSSWFDNSVNFLYFWVSPSYFFSQNEKWILFVAFVFDIVQTEYWFLEKRTLDRLQAGKRENASFLIINFIL